MPSLAAEKEFVGVLALAVEDDVAERIGLSDSQKASLLELIDARESEVVDLAMQARDLEPAEREARLAPFRRESEQKGLALLTEEQRQRLNDIRMARTGLAALAEPGAAQRIGLRPDQQARITEIARQRGERMSKADRRSAAKIAMESESSMASVLDEEQKQAWQAISGRPGGETTGFAPRPTPPGGAPPLPPRPPLAVSPEQRPGPPPDMTSPAAPGTASPAPAGPPPQVPVAAPPGSDDGAVTNRGPNTTVVVPPSASPSDGATNGNAASITAMGGKAPQAGNVDEVGADELPGASAGLRFSFRFQPWQDVLQWFADQAGLSLIFETLPQGTFNYTDDRVYMPAEAIDLLNSVLLIKGYTLVRKDRMLILINLEDGVPPNLVSTVPESELDQRGDYELISVLFELDKFSPEEAEKEIQRLIGPQGSVVVLSKTRQLLVTETAGRLRTIRQVIRRIEDPQGLTSGQLRSFELKNLMPEEALSVLRPLLDIPAESSASSDGTLRLALDPLGSKLLASGTPEVLARVEQILQQIDVPGTATAAPGTEAPLQLQVYSITGADPQSTLSVLQTLLAGLPDVRMAIDPKTNNLVALGRATDHATIKATLDELQSETSRVEVIHLRTVDPTVAVLTIKKLFGDSASDPRAPVVEADGIARQLLVKGSEAQIEQIKTFLQQLGETSLGGDMAAAGDTIRVLPLSGRSAESALQRIQEIWPALRANPIRVVTPSAMIATMRSPGEPAAADLDKTLFDDLLRSQQIFEVPASPQTPAQGPAQLPAPSSEPPAATAPGATPPANPASGVSVPAEGPTGPGPNRSASLWGARLWLVATPLSETPPSAAPQPPVPAASEPQGSAPVPTKEAQPAGAPAAPAPIVVSVGPSGIMIASEDPEALDQFEELLNTLAGGTASGASELTVFYLKHSKAPAVAETINQIMGGSSSTSSSSRGAGGSLLGDLAGAAIGGTGGRLVSSLLGVGGGSSYAPTGSVRIVPDARLNALIVEANAIDTGMVEQLLKILDQRESPEDVLAEPKAQLIPVLNTQASEIAEILRQVYQDRLSTGGSGGDRGGGDRPSPEQIMELLRGSRDGRSSGRGAASEIEKMSIGVDERTNSIVVVAPDHLFQEVKLLVAELDRAALDSNQGLEVLSLNHISPQLVQEALSSLAGASVNVRGGTSSSGRSSSSSGSPGSSSRSGDSRSSGSSADDMQRRMEFFRSMQERGFFRPPDGGGGFRPPGSFGSDRGRESSGRR